MLILKIILQCPLTQSTILKISNSTPPSQKVQLFRDILQKLFPFMFIFKSMPLAKWHLIIQQLYFWVTDALCLFFE